VSGAVGFVGLGNIGKPMATRLLAWPGGLWVYDVVPEAVAELVELGAHAADSVADLAGRVDLLCVMVRDDDQVREVLGQILGVAAEGLTVAVHSTIAADTPAQLESIAERHGVHLVDAPVSGGPMGAAEGTLAIMVGGSAQGYAACEKPFALMGSKVLHAGEAGAGTRMKLARNMLHFISFTAATEAQRLAEAAGLDLIELGNVVRHTDAITGGPGAIMHRDSTAQLDPDDFWYGVFDHVRALGEKDLAFAVELAESLQVDVPLARQALIHLGTGLGVRSTS
jgi:3-hydroxyisobutyrate dehydrogenase-like beta-hydroxyacid dehydrogenase